MLDLFKYKGAEKNWVLSGDYTQLIIALMFNSEYLVFSERKSTVLFTKITHCKSRAGCKSSERVTGYDTQQHRTGGCCQQLRVHAAYGVNIWKPPLYNE